jgi:hypothetical protein
MKKVTKLVVGSALALSVLSSSLPAFAITASGDIISDSPTVEYNEAYIPSVSLPSDVVGTWAEKSVANMVYMGVVKGYPDGTFRPSKAVNRAEFATAMKNALYLPNAEELAELRDMPASHWAAKSVSSVLPFLPAFPDGTFRPAAAATREDVAVALVLATGLDKKVVDSTIVDVMFKDYKAVSPALKNLIAIAVDQKLIKGTKVEDSKGQYTDADGKKYNLYLNPQKFVTRAEMCSLLDSANKSVSLGNKILPATEE